MRNHILEKNMKEVQLQKKATIQTMVEDSYSAKTVGSGDVAVYATPMMIALMEQAAKTVLSPYLDEEETSVGIYIEITHDAPTPIGMEVYATATITKVEGRTIYFDVVAKDACGIIGKGIHKRAVIKTERFMQRTQEKLQAK